MLAATLLASRPRIVLTVRLALAALIAFLVLGNLAIAGTSAWMRRSASAQTAAQIEAIGNFRVVDTELWRGAAPSPDGYRSLAAAGVWTLVDLRAEDDLEELAFAAGLDDGDRPGPVLVAASRVLDAPHRLWARLSA